METEFSKRLKRWLDEKDVRGVYTRLAKHVGVSPQSVQQWVSGETQPKNDKYPLIADFLGKTEIEVRYGAPLTIEENVTEYAVKKNEPAQKTDSNKINANELIKLIDNNIATASLDKLLAIKKILEMKEDHVTGAHELIELVEQLLAKKRSNGE